MKFIYDGSWIAEPKANFILESNTQLLIYQWLKSLCFFYGYALNMFRLVNLDDETLYGMKNHDFHVFIKILIHLFTKIYCQKGYERHSQRSIIFLEIYDLLSYLSST